MEATRYVKIQCGHRRFLSVQQLDPHLISTFEIYVLQSRGAAVISSLFIDTRMDTAKTADRTSHDLFRYGGEIPSFSPSSFQSRQTVHFAPINPTTELREKMQMTCNLVPDVKI